MNTIWLKLIGCTVVALAVVVVGYIFRPTEPSGPPEAKDERLAEEEGKDELTREVKLRRLEARRSALPTRPSREISLGQGNQMKY